MDSARRYPCHLCGAEPFDSNHRDRAPESTVTKTHIRRHLTTIDYFGQHLRFDPVVIPSFVRHSRLVSSARVCRVLASVLAVGGAGAIIYGGWLIWPPAAWLAGGVFALWQSWAFEHESLRTKNDADAAVRRAHGTWSAGGAVAEFPGLGSNQESQLQRLVCYHYTTRESLSRPDAT